MNVLQAPRVVESSLPQRFVLNGVSWQEYDKLVDALAEHHVRMTYDRGSLELISPLPPHEIYKKWFGFLLAVLAEELDVPIKGCGSTTFRRQDLERGLEPDECFYLGSAARISNWRMIDLTRDPPPDLAVEVDITTNALDRIGIYAALGVPEVWRFDGTSLHVYVLGAGGTYQRSPGSLALPFLSLGEVMPFLHQSVDAPDDGAMLRALRAWVRARVLPARDALAGGQPPPQGTPQKP